MGRSNVEQESNKGNLDALLGRDILLFCEFFVADNWSQLRVTI